MGEEAKETTFEGGEVVFAGGTDWAGIGRVTGGGKKGKEVDPSRAAKYPNLVSPVRLKSLLDVKITFVAAGSAACHCIVGDKDGKCYTWGRNERGQLGQGDLVQYNVPTIVKGLAGSVVIGGAAGKHHSAVVTSNGESFTFGSNKEGQCGTGSIKSTPKSEELLLSPARALVEGCSAVACGAEFTMWLTREGRLLSAGCPQHGQLGHGTDHEYNAKDSSVKLMYAPQPTPEVIQALADKSIRAVACGHNHTLALDTGCAAYTWGDGGYGRLGHNVQRDEFTPKQVETLTGRMPVDVNSPAACGATSSLCTMVGEQLLSWGKLKASGDNTMRPKLVFELAGWRISALACGGATYGIAATLGDETSTITWGQAQHGELGYGPKGKKSSANPDKCQALEGVTTHQIAMGTGYSLFLVDPAHEAVKALEVWEPEEATCEPANPEGTGDAGGAKGKGKAGGGKRKADAAPAGRARSKKA